MDDVDFDFDFESNLNAGGPDVAALPSTAGGGVAAPGGMGGALAVPQNPGNDLSVGGSGRPRFSQYVSKKNYRQTVCRHWLRGLCMKGEQCGFLHQFDQSRMPVCRFFAKFGVCREPDCVFKHSTEEVKECNMYNLGFCIHGPLCRYKHIQREGPPPPPENVEQAKPRQFRNVNLDSKAHLNNRRTMPSSYPRLQYQPQQQQLRCLPLPPSNQQQQQRSLQPGAPVAPPYRNPYPGAQQRGPQGPPVRSPSGPPGGAPPTSPQPPLPPHSSPPNEGPASKRPRVQEEIPAPPPPRQVEQKPDFFDTEKCRYFVVHVRNKKDFTQAFSTKQWPTNMSIRMKLNEAYNSVANVVLVFVDLGSQDVCGCARMEGTIAKPKTMMMRWPGRGGGAGGSGTIPLKWLSRADAAVSSAQQRKPLAQTRDGQEIDQETGKAASRSVISA